MGAPEAGGRGKPAPLRWLTENVADTRTSGPPSRRRYLSPFARTWTVLRGIVERRRGWSLSHADDVEGQMTVLCRTPILRFRDDLVVWVSLDREGLTRVDARSRSRVGRGDLGVNRRRVERLLRELDRRLERV